MEICRICNKEQSKYCCPRCNLNYCSLDCYKNESHTECTEEFYKKNIQEELLLRSQEDAKSSKNKIYDILQRVQNEDFVYEGDDDIEEEIDSDDDLDTDITERLQGIDINDHESVWKQLTQAERQQFEDLVSSGDITRLVPEYKPWWSSEKTLIEEVNKEIKKSPSVPEILKTIPNFDELTKKPLSPCLHFNICNILGSYTILVKFYNGEHRTDPQRSVQFLLTLSKTLKANENFYNYERCIEDILEEIELANLELGVAYEDINKDVQMILVHPSVEYILRGLSDVHHLFFMAKKELSEGQNCNGNYGQEQKEFSRRFGMEPNCSVTKRTLTLTLKKLEFLMASVLKNNK